MAKVDKELAQYLFKKIVNHQNDKEVKKKRPMLMCGIFFNQRDIKQWIKKFKKNEKKSWLV